MDNDFNKISNYWKSEYSKNINDYKAYNASDQFKQIANLFAPGQSFYYILNFHNLEIDHISPSVKSFTDKEPDQVSMNDLLALALPEEIESLQLKEQVIQDFFIRYLKPEEILDYKLIYTYRMKDSKGNIRTMLHQATPLSLGSHGFFEHVFSVHSDISHLKVTSNNNISFVNNKGGKSFYNLPIESGKFHPQINTDQSDLSSLFSEREKEIIGELAKGSSAKEIATNLHISPHTVKTHRKNILQKSDCTNTAQLIANCLTGGVINIA